MRRRSWKHISSGIGVVVLICCSSVGYAGTTSPEWLNMERFRELPWGATLEKAQTVYQDLTFVRYAITNERETPAKVYERKNEVRTIGGIRVDGIRYGFRNNSFCKVTIHLNSKVGPRTITTPAAEAFDRLSGQISGAMGEPTANRIDQGISGTNKKMVWLRGEMSVTLMYLEPPGMNDDDLILEIVKEPTVLKSPIPD